MDIVIFAVLTWYLDNVMSSNRGKTAGPLFFLDCFKSSKLKDNKIENTIKENLLKLENLE